MTAESKRRSRTPCDTRKHRAVNVVLLHQCDEVTLLVEDDGQGFDVAAAMERLEGRLGLGRRRHIRPTVQAPKSIE